MLGSTTDCLVFRLISYNAVTLFRKRAAKSIGEAIFSHGAIDRGTQPASSVGHGGLENTDLDCVRWSIYLRSLLSPLRKRLRYLAIMDAKTVIHIGIGLICFGIAALTDPSVTSTSRVAENAYHQVSTENRGPTSVSPFVAGLLLVGGVVFVAIGAKVSPH